MATTLEGFHFVTQTSFNKLVQKNFKKKLSEYSLNFNKYTAVKNDRYRPSSVN
jgi:hypothetical protein